MKLSDIINEKLILTDLKANSLREVFEEMVNHLKSHQPEIDETEIIKSLWDREQEKTTVRNCNFAIPRARTEIFNDFVFMVGRSKEGIDCGANDGNKTHLFLILIANIKKNKVLIQTKKAVYELARDNKKREALINASNAKEMLQIMENSEIHITQTLTAFDIMNPHVTYATEDMTLLECANIFYQHGISGLPVLNAEGELLGVVTEKEIIKVGLPPYLELMNDLSFLKEFEPFEEFYKQQKNVTVGDIYTDNYTAVTVDTSIIEIAFLVATKNVRRLFVIDRNKLIGIIMRRDLITQVIHC